MATIGFLILMIIGFLAEPLVIKKFIGRSKLIVEYYYYIFPFAFGMLFFAVIEGYCWAIHQSVMSNFLKETLLRLFTLIGIVLFYTKLISYHNFILLFRCKWLL